MVTFLELLTVMNSIVIKLLIKTYKNIVIDGKIGLIYTMQYLHCDIKFISEQALP